MAKVNSYLAFEGQCEEAFKLYESVFEKKISYITYYKDVPASSEWQVADAQKNLVMHVALPISSETMLLGCDTTHGYSAGNNISICISAESAEEAKHIFDGLSEGGTIIMPLGKTYWAELFGMLIDKYGICWLMDWSNN